MITVGVVTRNRPELLAKCLSSLALLGEFLGEVIVVDDTSDVPVDRALRDLPKAVADRVRTIHQSRNEGYIVGRNRIMREASNEFVLLMDDDAWLLGADGVREAVSLAAEHETVGAIAFAMATADGEAWDAGMQPARANYPARVPSFIGFAHLLRRSLFLRLGGYRESFQFYGEEKDYCLRMLDAGYGVVYLPHARIVHVADLTGRDYERYVRHTIRNDCLAAIYNEPFPLPVASIPLRLMRYAQMRRPGGGGGMRWIVSELVRGFAAALRERRPVAWSTLRRWRAIRRSSPAWVPGTRSKAITVGITSRNRHDILRQCLESLTLLGDRVGAIVVVDDASDEPVSGQVGALPAEVARKLTIIRHTIPRGNIPSRNVAMRQAETDVVLLLDDDTYLLDAATVEHGLSLMDADRSVAAVGFAMAAKDGSLLPDAMQPSPATYACYVPSYIGFAHLIRRGAFFQVGAYRELFQRHGEEKECCLRLMDAGYDVVYLPERIVHLVDPTGRDIKRYLRTVIRNDCLGALFNEPFPMPMVSVPTRLWRYLVMRRSAGVSDPGGLRWILSELAAKLPAVWRNRHPVKWATIRKWRYRRRHWPAYRGLTA